MSKEDLSSHFRDVIGNNRYLGWKMMDKAAGLFERLCIPEEAFPDDKIMDTPEMDVEAAMWGFIISVQRQAETEGKYHHDYADAISVTLLATANVLVEKPEKVEEIKEFKEITKFNPNEYLELFGQE